MSYVLTRGLGQVPTAYDAPASVLPPAYTPEPRSVYDLPTTYTAYEPPLPPLTPPPSDAAFIGEGCSAEGLPPLDELAVLRAIERINAYRAQEVRACDLLTAAYEGRPPPTTPTASCARQGQEKFGEQTKARQAELAALCAAKRAAAEAAPPRAAALPPVPSIYDVPAPPAQPTPAPEPTPLVATTYEAPAAREPETETPEEKQPYVQAAPPVTSARAGLSTGGLLLAAVVIGGAYVGWKVTRTKKG